MRKTGIKQAQLHNTITLKDIHINENTIRYSYHVEGRWKKCFHLHDPMIIEYNRDISATPPSIAVIPFLCNILPICWITDATVYVDTIDQDFFNSLDDIKQGYISMYPMIEFKGTLEYNTLVDNSYRSSDRVGLFFSGGSDSLYSLIQHRAEHPLLITLLGADVEIDNVEGAHNLMQASNKASIAFDLDNVLITSNFRTMIHERVLDVLVKDSSSAWWHGFQHGIAMSSLAAPITYKDSMKTLYKANSYHDDFPKKVLCASYTGIDDQLHMASCNTILSGRKPNRYEKIAHVADYLQTNGHRLDMLVCYEIAMAQNCCRCVKCIRTIISLMMNGYDPRDYGFHDFDLEEIEKVITHRAIITEEYKSIWQDYKDRYNHDPVTVDPAGLLQWVGQLNVDRIDKTPIKQIKIWNRKIRKSMKNILFKI